MLRLPHLTLIFTLTICLVCSIAISQTSNRYISGTGQADHSLATSHHNAQILPSDFVSLAPVSDNLWERLRDGFGFANIENTRIDEQLWFLQSGRGALENSLTRAKPYLFYIADQLEQAGIPLDIALLPLIESAFIPDARSSQSAVGIWQFIPTTAREYGLQIDRHFDQRLDVIASTDAAIRYLQALHTRFDGDWLLALAAYNTGPGRVRDAMDQAVERGVEPTYWFLNLSTETSNYVPRLIAANKIISDPKKFDVVLPHLANQKRIETVTLDTRISLQQAAELTTASFEEINRLNPALPNGMTPIFGPHRIVVPAAIAGQLRRKLNNMQRLLLVNRQTQLELARRNISTPLAVDSNVQNDSLLDHKNYTSSLASRFDVHTVKQGDTLWGLSRQTGVKIDTLRSWNNLTTNAPIKTGDQLRIAYIDADNDTELLNYRVVASDSLSSIASKFDLAISDIKKWNHSVRNENYIQVGQVLMIPTPHPGSGQRSDQRSGG